MAWYRTGTVAVTNGSTAVVGTGTIFVANTIKGEGFLAPDGKIYEIASVNSNTSLTLASNYQGSTASGQAYAILPTQNALVDLAAQAAELINSFAAVRDGIGQGLISDGNAAAPGIRFANDPDTGFYRYTTNQIGVGLGGVNTLRISNIGISLAGTSTFYSGGDGEILAGQDDTGYYFASGSGVAVPKPITFGANATFIRFNTANLERMRLAATGNLLLGHINDQGYRLNVQGTLPCQLKETSGNAENQCQVLWQNSGSGNNVFTSYCVNGTLAIVGGVSYNRSGGTVTYATTSDYRAKDEIGPVDFKKLAKRFKEVRPFVGKMHGAKLQRTMFFAHELQELFPAAVTGKKDEVDAEGNPVFQQVDHSVMIPDLVAMIQYLVTRNEELEAQAATFAGLDERLAKLEALAAGKG